MTQQLVNKAQQGNVIDYRRHSFRKQPLVVSISSGKGGVGKTLTVVNMAISAQRMGYKVLIIDGDLGMANVDIVLGLTSRYNIRDVLDGAVSLNDVVLEGPAGIRIIPSGSGIASLQNLNFIEKQILSEQLHGIQNSFDLYIVDTGAGIGSTVVHMNMMANRRVLVTTSEPHAMTDAYAMMKVFSQQGVSSCDLIVNLIRSPQEGEVTAHKLKEVAKSFLNMDVDYLGGIPFDRSLPKFLLRRDLGNEEALRSFAAQAWTKATRTLLSSASPLNHDKSFFSKILLTEEAT